MKNIERQSILQRSSDALRQRSQYDAHTEEVRRGVLNENVTPPVGLNLRLLSDMASTDLIRRELDGKPISASILGLATHEGAVDFKNFVNSSLRTQWDNLNVVEIDEEMIRRVNQLGLPDTTALHEDASQTTIESDSQDMVIRDHLGNCCPPDVDRAVNREVARILKPGGISIVNITTSELLPKSDGRKIMPNSEIPDTIQSLLIKDIYDLGCLEENFPGSQLNQLEGQLIEIEPGGSFVIFAEGTGDGEWFRPLSDHTLQWMENGFQIMQIQTRVGTDSHTPPLQCVRHIAVMRKI